jgi:hypothetical protein
MARYRGKKALYEVMSKARTKSAYGKAVEPIHPKKTEENEAAGSVELKPAAEKSRTTTLLWKKPRIIQVNAGRIEFSIPYQIVIALLLGLLLLILAAFRIGQFFQPTELQVTKELNRGTLQTDLAGPAERDPVSNVKPSTIEKGLSSESKPVEPAKSTGNNVIVLAQYNRHLDLAPVQEHFRKYGIETEIVMENGVYFLQTINKYDNPGRPGTDGYAVLQKIIQVGAKYKAPPNCETFASHYFDDAYGKKVEE